MADSDALTQMRERIDAIDAQLIEILNDRARLVQQVAHVKAAQGDTDSYYRPEREAQILRRVLERNPGPLAGAGLVAIFREVISACFALEQGLRVAYFGPAGTYTEAAMYKHFGRAVAAVACPAIDDVFRAVETGECACGVVPVENSFAGAVTQTLDRLVDSSARICGEIELPIHHQLLVRDPALDISRVYAHAQALAQCRGWLAKHLPGVPCEAVASNGEAARMASQAPGTAAIAGTDAATIYELAARARNIEDDPRNSTRFLVIGARATPPSGDDKTSLVFAAANQAGALHRALGAFAEHGISMTRIESRPSRRGNWEYLFFVDIQGHADDPKVALALEEFARRTSMLKLLGAYPRAVL
ncbi:MAG: prephenate dehydratase [Gammaproteobacteria bacterium]